MGTKYFNRISFVLIVIVFILTNSSCFSHKEIAQNFVLNDTLTDFSKNRGFFIDERDGKRYSWVKIGNQIWMAENLAYKLDSGCVSFKFKESKVKKYGYYYSWKSATKACPNGWHLPTEEEIDKLQDVIGKFNYDAFDSLQKNKDYGLNLKKYGYFDAEKEDFIILKLPYIGQSTFWISDAYSTKSGQKVFRTFFKDYFWRTVGKSSNLGNHFYPVRCIKDFNND